MGRHIWMGTVLEVDRFGNLITNFAISEFEQLRTRPFAMQVGVKYVSRLVETYEAKSEEKTGKAQQTVRIEKAGRYLLRATGTDRFGNPVSGAAPLLISGTDDKVRLRILADKHHYKVGETGKVQLHWREKPALALIEYARMNDVDQVLIGAPGGGAVKRSFAGVCAQVAADVPCSVTVVRPRQEG
jgi:uncharacterized protein YfaS (alpha-2-macroglobulin family)